jgi:hypothetical protein
MLILVIYNIYIDFYFLTRETDFSPLLYCNNDEEYIGKNIELYLLIFIAFDNFDKPMITQPLNYGNCDLRWLLDGRMISTKGIGYTARDEVVLFELSKKINFTDRVTWQIGGTHSSTTEGVTLHCQAQYKAGIMGNINTFKRCLSF